MRPAGVVLAVGAFCVFVRPNRIAAESLIFLSLWMLYPVFATRLTYLAATVGLEQRDALLAKADAAIGFDWMSWARLLNSNEWTFSVLTFVYGSYYWQPVLSIVIFAAWAQGRNREMLTAMWIASTVTVAMAAFLPALGPGHVYGIKREWEDVIAALRSGSRGPLPYLGIVTFPSFHTSMSTLFIIAHRGLWSFGPFLVLNILMLLSIPYSGDHYAVDMMAGAVVAIASFCSARIILAKFAAGSEEGRFVPIAAVSTTVTN